MKSPLPHTKLLLAAQDAGARILSLDGVPVRLSPRSPRDPWPWIDAHGGRYPGSRCRAQRAAPLRVRGLSRGEIRRRAEETGIDWELILGRAGR